MAAAEEVAMVVAAEVQKRRFNLFLPSYSKVCSYSNACSYHRIIFDNFYMTCGFDGGRGRGSGGPSTIKSVQIKALFISKFILHVSFY